MIIDKEREKNITELARRALNNIDPEKGIVFLDGFRDYLATNIIISDKTLREEFARMLSMASKGDKNKLDEAIRFVDLNLNLLQDQIKKDDHSNLKEEWRKWLKKKSKPKPRAPIAENKKSAIINSKKRRFYAALDFLFPLEVNKNLWDEANKVYEEAIKYGIHPRGSVELALKKATEEDDEEYNKAIAIALPRMKKWLKGLIIALAIITFIAIVIVVVVQLIPSPAAPVETTAITVADTATTVPETTVPETTVPATPTGNPKFWQVKGNNEKNKVDADFEAKYAEAISQDVVNYADAVKKLLLDNAANNAQRLAIWAHGLGLYNDPNDWEKLVEGDYLSPEGEALYYKFEGALSAKGVTITEKEAGKDWVNTGVNEKTGDYGKSQSPGITGDKTVIEVALPNGTESNTLTRCGNGVFEKDVDLPIEDTDNPKVTVVTTTTAAPPETTTTTAAPPETTTTVPEETTTTLAPKSPDEADDKQPGDGSEKDSGTGEKSEVSEESTPESTPTDVVTEQVINGVTETASNPSGSETGVGAVGTTDNSVTSTTTPPPETGVNPGDNNDGNNTSDAGIPSNF